MLGAVVAAKSTDLTGAEPPPYRGSPGSTVVRVGLETDLQRVTVPCCERLWVEHGGARRLLEGGFEVTPGGEAKIPVYKLQTAALKDEDQARALARSLERSTGEPAQVSFDVASSLYRVRLGRFATREGAERLAHRLVDQGIDGAWVTQEGGGLEHAALVLASGEPRTSREAEGRWLVIEPDGQPGVRLARGRYRGRVLVYLNDRGLLNVIDELPLEDYLRGVVPVEMGPELYDTLDALKSQAVAARTYTVRTLGGFAAEGFDLCASPRCQAYGGMDAEHPLSDRAVGETGGEIVLYQGEIADALYSASCGGSTENVEVVFPQRHGDHLRAVPCAERGAVRIEAGAVSPDTAWADRIVELLVEQPVGSGRGRSTGAALHQARIESLVERAGLPVPAGSLRSLERAEVRRYLQSALDLTLDATVLRDAPVDSSTAAAWTPDERRLHARFSAAAIAERPTLTEVEMRDTTLDVARLLDVARDERAYFLDYGKEGLEVRTGDQRRRIPIAPTVATFARKGGELRGAPLALAPGDRLRLFWSGDRLLAVASDREGENGPYQPASPWTVFRGEDELRRTVANLYPGFSLRDLEVVSRGISGRVGSLRLLGEGRDTVVIEGLAVRWTLGTPETWFDLRRGVEDGSRGWLMQGRGRGHGVGMCQLGAVAMSRRGQTYKEILAHYYAGARLGRLLGPSAESVSAIAPPHAAAAEPRG
jgi:stage II sporulation protein D